MKVIMMLIMLSGLSAGVSAGTGTLEDLENALNVNNMSAEAQMPVLDAKLRSLFEGGKPVALSRLLDNETSITYAQDGADGDLSIAKINDQEFVADYSYAISYSQKEILTQIVPDLSAITLSRDNARAALEVREAEFDGTAYLILKYARVGSDPFKDEKINEAGYSVLVIKKMRISPFTTRLSRYLPLSRD